MQGPRITWRKRAIRSNARPVLTIEHVLHRGAESRRPAFDFRRITGAGIETGPGVEFLGIGLVDVLTVGINRTAGEGEPFKPWRIPFGPQIGLHVWHTDRFVATVGGCRRIGQFAVEHRHAAHQASARCHLAEHAQLDPTVALFGLYRKHVTGADFTARFLDLEQRQGGHEGAVFVFHTEFMLLRFIRRECLAGIGRRPRCNIPFAQAFYIVVVEGNVFPRLDHYTDQRRGGAFVVFRTDRTRCVVVARFDVLPTHAKGQLETIIEHGQCVGQRNA